MTKTKFNTKYNYNRDAGITFTEESLTQQQFKNECDINNILRNVEKGILPDLIKTNPQYGDFTKVTDYQEALNTVLFAKEQFLALPSQVRERFGNDPSLFLEFATEPANMESMVELGLATQTNPDPILSEIKEMNKNIAKTNIEKK